MAPLSGHQMLAAGTQPAGRISAKAPSYPGCQHSHPALGKGPPASTMHPCHQLQLPAETVRVPVFLPSQPPHNCRQRVSVHAASLSTQQYWCQLPARQGEAATMLAGNVERFPDPMSHLYKTICLLQIPSWVLTRLWRNWKDTATGDIPPPVILKPLPACSGSTYKRMKSWSALCSPDEPAAVEVLGVSAGSCMTKQTVYHPSRTPSSHSSLSLFPVWSMPKAGARETGLCVNSAVLFSASGSCSASLTACWVLGWFWVLCWELLFTAPLVRRCWGLSQLQLYGFKQMWF